MTCFAHLSRPSLQLHVRALERGEILCAGAFSSLLDVIDPPLMSSEDLLALREQLAEFPSRRAGAPKAGRSRAALADKISNIQRSDVPSIFLSSLADLLRVRREQPKVIYRRMRKQLADRERSDRNLLMRACYGIFYNLEGNGPWAHPRLGRIEQLDQQAATRAERALKLTHRWLHARGYFVPSERTMMNIICNRPRFRELDLLG